MTDTKIGEVILDQSFVKRVQKGEHDAVDALYNACFSVLMNVAVRYKTNRADQITLVHIAFMKALDHLSDFTLGTSFIAWIAYFILSNGQFFRRFCVVFSVFQRLKTVDSFWVKLVGFPNFFDRNFLAEYHE